MKYILWIFLGLTIIIGASACQSPKNTSPTSPTPSASGSQTGRETQVTQIPPRTSTPTSTVQVFQPGISEPPGQSKEIMRFVFPTPARQPISSWRPPLYPTPWVPTKFDHFYFVRPIAANEINWPLADYRYGGNFLPEVIHTGIDIPAETGTPVIAAGSGRVIWAGYGLFSGKKNLDDPYGLAIAIKHDFGYRGESLFTIYGHLQQCDVIAGQEVDVGEQIGLVGQTGKVTGAHLHFEVRLGKNQFYLSRNPELWLAPPQGWGVLAARILTTGGTPLYDQVITVRSRNQEQSWKVKTYGKGTVVSDAYYDENLVLGDLPAGHYEIWIPYAGSTYNLELQVRAGMVSFFTFRGRKGFDTGLPSTPDPGFIPSDEGIPPTP